MLTAAATTLSGRSADAREFVTGFDEPAYKSATAQTRNLAFDRTVSVNGRVARLDLIWANAAPTRPKDPFNPGDPAYRFATIDAAINGAAAHGLDVLLTISVAPAWAESPGRDPGAPPGSWRPQPNEVEAFAIAVARRYSGSYVAAGAAGPLPQVRHYQAWNEPNLSRYITPQYVGKKPVSPGIYRRLLDRFWAGVKSVSSDNVVITGGTAPFGEDPGGSRVRPLAFWRRLLCLRGRRALKPRRCPLKARFDIAAHHPLNTVGGPRESAANEDDVVIADMGELRRVIRVAERRRRVRGGRPHPLWATEFWWETNPPDPRGVSLQVQARWIEEAFYVLFKKGVRVALMIGVSDVPYTGRPGSATLQSGLFFENGQAKPSMEAFRFPFVVARRGKRRAEAWAIAPTSGTMVIERLAGGAWKAVRQLSVRRFEVVRTNVPPKKGQWRVRIGAESSLAWRFRAHR